MFKAIYFSGICKAGSVVHCIAVGQQLQAFHVQYWVEALKVSQGISKSKQLLRVWSLYFATPLCPARHIAQPGACTILSNWFAIG